VRVSPAEYLRLPLRAHELLRDIPLHDVSVVDLPGGGPDRSLADIRALQRAAPPSRIARALFGARRVLGRVFGWDRVPTRAEDSLLSRLSTDDRLESEIVPGTPDGAFLILYQFARESLSETRNATVHGWISLALIPAATGYRLYFAVYARPVSWLTRPYLMAIEPFRRLLYPAMLRRIRSSWIAAYGASTRGDL
jgi:hypothetical protein